MRRPTSSQRDHLGRAADPRRLAAPGTHVDCVGAYKPNMRETDDAVVRRARIYVDTRPGAFAEAGDIVQPLAAGVIGKEADPRRSVRADPRHRRRAPDAGGDHLFQVRRRRHRGSGGGHCRIWRCLTLWTDPWQAPYQLGAAPVSDPKV